MAADSRVALVTGASSGIGLETAAELLGRGWTVWAGVRGESGEQAVQRRVAAPTGAAGRLHCVRLEVRDEESVRRGVGELVATAGRGPDLVVANAGVGGLGFVENLPIESWRTVLDINLLGVVRTVQAALPAMRRHGGGHLVLVSSNAANMPHPAFSAYAASKWAIEAMAEALALELGHTGIAVTIVQPGAVRSGFAGRIVGDPAQVADYGAVLERMAPAWQWLADHAITSERVARAIADVAERSRPPLRLRVGRDAHVAGALRHLVPGGVRRAVFRRFYRLAGRTATRSPVHSRERKERRHAV